VSNDANGAALDKAFRAVGESSFAAFLSAYDPTLLPGGQRDTYGAPAVIDLSREVPHGTTIVAATFADGVVMAGDRRATMGNVIAQRDIEKVFPADEYSCIGIAGVAGLAVEMVKLFQVELEHYEKIEGTTLSLDGKANRLAGLIRGNLPMAMQGLAVVPLFAGYDLAGRLGRIFSYDVTGGRYEEQAFHSVGSGSVFARGALKKLYFQGMTRDECVAACVQALFDAADDDSATGGPDVYRRIYPMVTVVTDGGYRRMAEADVADVVDRVLAGRHSRPDGPVAALFTAPPAIGASAGSPVDQAGDSA